MDVPSFHDGYFEGLRLGPDKLVHLFLRTVHGESYTLTLRGVERLALTEVRQGNILFDLVFRGPEEITLSDIQDLYLYGNRGDTSQATNLLQRTHTQGFRVLEINATYGAQGLVLFQDCEIANS